MAQQPNPIPDMPALPAAPGQATARMAFVAEDARRQRNLRKGSDTNAKMTARGQDSIRVFDITASPAGYNPANPNQQLVQAMQGMEQAMQGMQAQLNNQRRRSRNARIPLDAVGAAATLVPLVKENLPLAGAAPAPAGAAPVGALPPQGIFPTYWDDVVKLTDPALDALEAFYGEQFGPANPGNQAGVLLARVAAFKAFII